MNYILEKQFLTDFGIDIIDHNHIFVCKEKQLGGRFLLKVLVILLLILGN
ncbi:hypothetical protein [Floricoccus penangensis]|nr:hypothetical protein [Floricoccus penangensis]URZ88398.1 hypothetical protein KIW23_05040 [Floricoccus penangensis]